MDDTIHLEPLPKDSERLEEALKEGRLAVARSNNDFLYILDMDGQFHMFTHTPGNPGGGQKRFPKDEKYTAMVRKLATLADAVFAVEFSREMNLYGVMASAEEAILTAFPGNDRDADEDVEFSVRGSEPEAPDTPGD